MSTGNKVQPLGLGQRRDSGNKDRENGLAPVQEREEPTAQKTRKSPRTAAREDTQRHNLLLRTSSDVRVQGKRSAKQRRVSSVEMSKILSNDVDNVDIESAVLPGFSEVTNAERAVLYKTMRRMRRKLRIVPDAIASDRVG